MPIHDETGTHRQTTSRGPEMRRPPGGYDAPVSELILALRCHVAIRGVKSAFTFLRDGEEVAARLSYAELDAGARAVASRLVGLAEPGDRAVLLYPPGPELVTAFLGCLYAAVVAVPAHPPRRPRSADRVRGIFADARPKIVLTTASLASSLRRADSWSAGFGASWIATDDVSDAERAEAAFTPRPATPEDVAFLQYTSGSTSAPKGVAVTHANLAANQRALERAFGTSEDLVVAGWLPVQHDMGLVGNVLHPLWVGGHSVLMSPMAFLRRPRRWPEAVSRFRAQVSGGPDFAYELCSSKIRREELEGLDLSCWRVAFNGAEPIRPATLERFAEAFAPAGFRSSAFLPCYGLAESTLFVTGGPAAAGVTVRSPEGGGHRRMGCGRPDPSSEVLAVDPEARTMRSPFEVGEIWVGGPSVAVGYWGPPEKSRESFDARLASGEGPYLRTGDLGFFDDEGELFVTGRIKDLVILRGRNLHPQDLESCAESAHSALVARGAAAFAVEGKAGEEQASEELVVVVESERRHEAQAAAAATAVRRALAEEHDAEPREVVVIRAGTLPRTTSGKVRRHACREAFLGGGLAAIGRYAKVPDRVGADHAATDHGELTEWIRREAARRAGVDPSALDMDAPLTLDSLSAVELANRLEDELGAAPPLSRLLAGATPAEIADTLRYNVGQAQPDSSIGTSRLPGEPAAGALSYGQRSLWFLHRLRPQGAAYNVAFAARLTSASSRPDAALRDALARLAERHPALVTTFHEENGEPYRKTGTPADLDFDEAEVHGLDDSAFASILADEAHRPFELDRSAGRWRLYRRRLDSGREDTVLLVALHHAVTDFWSLVVLLDDLGRIYGRPAAGDPAPPRASYDDFVAAERRLVASPEGQLLQTWWRRRLTPLPAELVLPAERPRPGGDEGGPDSDRGAAYVFPLAGDALTELTAPAGTTAFAAILTMFTALLGRYSGQDRFLVGAPTAGRRRTDFEDVAGYFVNAVPLIADLGGRPSVNEALARCRHSVAEALEHAAWPLSLLVEDVRPERAGRRSPLFKVLLVYEQPQRLGGRDAAALVLGTPAGGGAGVELGGLVLEPVALERRTTPSELVLSVVESGGTWTASLQYSTELFDATTIHRLARHLLTLTRSAADAEPDRPLHALGLLVAGERHQLLDEWNDTASTPPAPAIEEAFAQAAAARGEATALVWEEGGRGREIGYRELDERSSRLAGHLRGLGVGAAGDETAVALALERSPELVTAILATLKAGGHYVPLDLGYPDERLAVMLGDARPRVVLVHGGAAQKRLRRLPAAEDARIVDLEDAGGSAALWVPPRRDPQRLAYVKFTSGSTGRPKGIAVTHAGVMRLVRETSYASFAPSEVFLQAAPASFDAATFEIWGALANGGRLVLAPPEPPSLGELGALLRRHSVTTAFLTTGLFHLMVHERPEGLATLRQLLTGGEVISPEAVRKALDALPSTRLIACYGPTETTTFATCDPLVSAPKAGEAVALGRPIRGTRVYVADRALRQTPSGASGELVIGGPGLARGYMGRAALSAGCFVPDPWSERPGRRLYRTGDLARRRGDGRLDFLGRRDRQVKVRGFRVEPGEVEARLAEHPGVRSAVVIARAGALQAAYTAVNGDPPGAAELRAHLGNLLPPHMVPSRLVALSVLPLGVTGKVDRAAVAQLLDEAAPRPDEDRPAAPEASARSAVAEVERRLATIWSQVLKIDEPARDENFFELGGHSLAMLEIQSRLNRELGREVPIAELFDHTTVGSLAAHLATAETLASPAAKSPPKSAAAAEKRAAGRRTAMRRQRLRRSSSGRHRDAGLH